MAKFNTHYIFSYCNVIVRFIYKKPLQRNSYDLGWYIKKCVESA